MAKETTVNVDKKVLNDAIKHWSKYHGEGSKTSVVHEILKDFVKCKGRISCQRKVKK